MKTPPKNVSTTAKRALNNGGKKKHNWGVLNVISKHNDKELGGTARPGRKEMRERAKRANERIEPYAKLGILWKVLNYLKKT